MKHRSTAEVVEDLRANGRLVVCEHEIDANLELAEVQRRVYANQGPAVYFPNVRGCSFPCVSNLFATLDQARFLFRHTLEAVRRVIELKIDPGAFPRRPFRYVKTPFTALSMLPRKARRGAVQQMSCRLQDLPQVKSWPDDGGPFVTLPQVLSADPRVPKNLMRVNLGMYRVQIAGNQYVANEEVGLHYQIHRGIGVHHQHALQQNQTLPVTITVGGSPAMAVAAVMPLPEGLPELLFAGALSGRRVPMLMPTDLAPVYADADFAIVGHVVPGATKPEGPFGDHLGYYSLQHDYPVLQVKHVWHRRNAVWPLTVVGRPPQEDTTFGQLIHELTSPIIPTVIPGVKAVHAVDESGVHPLLLAVGSERYMPFIKVTQPAEILTQANAILGNGQLSLAKYLLIADGNSDPAPDIHHVQPFFQYVLERIDWKRDLHFHTKTTIDTLDYSGEGLNRGSKVVMAVCGPAIRQLASQVPADLSLPDGFRHPRVVAPGILAIESTLPATVDPERTAQAVLSKALEHQSLDGFPLITLVDDSEFVSRQFKNWIWVTFTRSNPAVDIDGVGGKTIHRHWGCSGSLIINALIKPHHAPPLVEDPAVVAKVDAWASRRDALSRWL